MKFSIPVFQIWQYLIAYAQLLSGILSKVLALPEFCDVTYLPLIHYIYVQRVVWTVECRRKTKPIINIHENDQGSAKYLL